MYIRTQLDVLQNTDLREPLYPLLSKVNVILLNQYKMETNRQKKIGGIIQKDIAEIIQDALRNSHKGVIVSVTEVKVTPDMMEARVYISVFPSQHRDALMMEIEEHSHLIRHQLALRIKNQMRRVPELRFVVDDSLDVIEGIDKALKGEEPNPIVHPEILPRRKKM